MEHTCTEETPVLTSNPAIVKQFCKDHNITLVVISPLSLLTAGLLDDLSASGVKCFGPTAKASLLQANKSNAKDFMQQHGIPTGRWKAFTNPHEACHFITYADFPALVVKSSCAAPCRKGPYISRDRDEACRAVQHLTQDWTPGTSTAPVIVEELLEGEEFYCLYITDGQTLAPIPAVYIQKPAGEAHKQQQSASTGITRMSENLSKKIHDNIIKKAIDGIRQEGWNYSGFFGAKIMVTGHGPMVIGLLCTFQGLDNQIIADLWKCDLYEVIQAATEGRLSMYLPVWTQDISLPYASSKQREPQARYQVPKELQALTKTGACESSEETSTSSCEDASKSWTVVEFPGCPDTIQQSRDRPRTPLPEESHAATNSDGSIVGTDIHETFRKRVSIFEVDTARYKDPMFLCTTNSIGDKVKVAQQCSLHKSAAQNLVTTCVNDLLSQGADTLFFMPYFSRGKLCAEVTDTVWEGLAEACSFSGCTLLEREIVGQSATHHDGCYSLFGCAMGVVEREKQLPQPEQMREGDVVLGIQSPGLHCSLLDLLTKSLERCSSGFKSAVPMSNGATTWGELVMMSTPVYSRTLIHTLRTGQIKACIPLTEGGLAGSILRYIPRSTGVVIDALCWRIPALYSWLYKEGGLSEEQLLGNFSCGLGVLIIAQRNVAQQILVDIQCEEEAWMVGGLTQHSTDSPRVQVRHLLEAMKINTVQLLRTVTLKKTSAKMSKVAVFISGKGLKLKIVIDTLRQLGSCAKLALIISNKSAVEELRRAVADGIPTRVVDHTRFTCHSDFENTICKLLEEFSIDVMCLAEFGRKFSEQFLLAWKGKILKLWPEQSTSQREEEPPGKRFHGCSVSFMLDGSSSPGPVVVQETFPADSEDPVSEQREEAKPRAVAKALHLVASRVLYLAEDGQLTWHA
ncbi:trifunctional purine biosynthetic protein adenosine-3-like isoform X2 [Hyperolius riggenbachi]|uniref:trifunctional purine biosynthetic protein adenosine-3-like isoform X2 n=1 Tax=Hyperolius riggenbachi TaxID=752182 RepID=UPI0035A29339